MSLLNEAKKTNCVFVSVMGPHAQESEKEIFDRKALDIDKVGESFWVSKINMNFIEKCYDILKGKVGYLILVESSNNGKSAADTKYSKAATHYSYDKMNWSKIDSKISPVTGNLGKKGATAYYYDGIEMCDDWIDLEYYGEVGNETEAIKFILGKSNILAKKNKDKLKGGMKSSKRKIVAVLRLKSPYVVWVK